MDLKTVFTNIDAVRAPNNIPTNPPFYNLFFISCFAVSGTQVFSDFMILLISSISP